MTFAEDNSESHCGVSLYTYNHTVHVYKLIVFIQYIATYEFFMLDVMEVYVMI